MAEQKELTLTLFPIGSEVFVTDKVNGLNISKLKVASININKTIDATVVNYGMTNNFTVGSECVFGTFEDAEKILQKRFVAMLDGLREKYLGEL
jgi:hypothetical protein